MARLLFERMKQVTDLNKIIIKNKNIYLASMGQHFERYLEVAMAKFHILEACLKHLPICTSRIFVFKFLPSHFFYPLYNKNDKKEATLEKLQSLL